MQIANAGRRSRLSLRFPPKGSAPCSKPLTQLSLQHTVRLHRLLPHNLPGLLHRACQLSGFSKRSGSGRRTRSIWSSSTFWKTIFAVAFGMGVVSASSCPTSSAPNWSVFSRQGRGRYRARDGLRGADRLLPGSGLFGVMLFGLNRVGPKLHFSQPPWSRSAR